MSLLPVQEARRIILGALPPLSAETVMLEEALLRVNAQPLAARRSNPPFAAAAMDGYAVRHKDIAAGLALKVVGEITPGAFYDNALARAEAARIYTGAAMPEGADTILIQEHAAYDASTKTVQVQKVPPLGAHIRAAGNDFCKGEMLIPAYRRLTPVELALIASMNIARLSVLRRPKIAILASGNELALPGGAPSAHDVIASTHYAIAGIIRQFGATPLFLGIARDTKPALKKALKAAQAAACDALITLGGASVGAYDLVHEALAECGLKLAFQKIAMRPGKPFMFGALNQMVFLGFPGNPVSSLVCAELFLKPMLQKWLRQPSDLPFIMAKLARPLPKNDARETYLRAKLDFAPNTATAPKWPGITPYEEQDSAQLGVYAHADALLRREPHAPPAREGALVEALPLHSKNQP